MVADRSTEHGIASLERIKNSPLRHRNRNIQLNLAGRTSRSWQKELATAQVDCIRVMVKRKLIRGLIALVAIGLLVPMMVMMFTLGMVGGSNMNMRSLSVMAGRINARMRMGKRIPHREERNNQKSKQSVQARTSLIRFRRL